MLRKAENKQTNKNKRESQRPASRREEANATAPFRFAVSNCQAFAYLQLPCMQNRAGNKRWTNAVDGKVEVTLMGR